MCVRRFNPRDVEQLTTLFHLSVTQGASSHYSVEERAVWSASPRSHQNWLTRLQPTTTWVAEEGSVITGFINLKPAQLKLQSDNKEWLCADIDCLFSHPEFTGRGVATALYKGLEEFAVAEQIRELTVEASFLAKPFFEKQGYEVLSKNQHPRAGQVLVNFSMHKILTMV
ncbi:GNAT family N-acetyltransferase [Shewanella sp. KX20019]|uniref:GNAT family N-acetyltransferase n=1 Tax=Shewanella sp. KX20019 TaxID=2803864 RepID=UPI00192694C7|nr:GNAT family N-acetyltransferase [Shewanella sp. KX20019]QQX82483.1 GNAT family N-acetyltransferase [Shewanella sp. KX20019]